jgi:chemotaxis protein methyltransferase CheR
MASSAVSMDFVRGIVRRRSAIVLDAGKDYLIEARLEPVARAAGFASIDLLVSNILAHPSESIELTTRVVEAMTTNETSFFRDIHPFEALRTRVLPDLVERRKATRTLNIWSAASSTGQEPYTIAMTIREHFPRLLGWKIRVLATDLSTQVIDRACRGVYSRFDANRGLPAKLVAKYFHRVGTEWELSPKIRSMVEFRAMNLIGPWLPFPPMDIIFLRNVLIYFDAEAKKKVLAEATSRLASDGYLFLGAADSLGELGALFKQIPEQKAGAYRRVSVK